MKPIIQRNIPIPSRPTKNKYPLYEMAVGDSFFMTPRRGQTVAQLRSAIRVSTYRMPLHMAFTLANVRDDDDTCEGVRCWRTH